MRFWTILALLAACDDGSINGADGDGDGSAGVVCDAVIPSSAEVVTSPQDFNASAGDVWICGGGGAATVNGSGGTYYVESGGLLTANSGSFTVYADDGATVTINASADVELYRTSGATVGANAAEVDETTCSSIEWDLSDAPADGC